MPKRIDLTGQVFGRLTVVEYSHTSNGHAHWKCICACGASCVHMASHMRTGKTTSCGCYRRDITTSHSMSGTVEYHAWENMFKRCGSPSYRNYSDYGGRGIFVCPEWESFETFYKDMGPRPSADHSVDRIDNDGPYCKDNCRWATRVEQQNNRRTNRLLIHNGETRTMSEWSSYSGIPYSTLRHRLLRGWDMDRALTEPTQKREEHDTSR